MDVMYVTLFFNKPSMIGFDFACLEKERAAGRVALLREARNKLLILASSVPGWLSKITPKLSIWNLFVHVCSFFLCLVLLVLVCPETPCLLESQPFHGEVLQDQPRRRSSLSETNSGRLIFVGTCRKALCEQQCTWLVSTSRIRTSVLLVFFKRSANRFQLNFHAFVALFMAR